MAKQQYVIYQVQLKVERGEAHFNEPLPNYKTVITSRDGWTALDTIFDQLGEGESRQDECPCPPSGPNGRGQIHLAVKQNDTEEDDEKSVNRSSVCRAQTSFGRHKVETLNRLCRDGVVAKLRLVPFEMGRPILETDKPYGVEIFDEE